MTVKEKEFLKCLWRCGVLSRKLALNEFKVSARHLYLLNKENIINLFDEKIFLGEEGIKYMRANYDFRYTTKFSNFKHDLTLATFYISLSPQVKETWVTQQELRYLLRSSPKYPQFKDKMMKLHPQKKFEAVVDAAIFDRKITNGYIGIEVISKHYSQYSIVQKKLFCEEFLCGYIAI